MNFMHKLRTNSANPVANAFSRRATHVVTGLVIGLLVALGTTTIAQAESLAMRNAQRSESMVAPTRGMSMAAVEQRFGKPLEVLPTRGGDTPRHPPINRWRYAGFTVYFERNRVIHSVAKSSIAKT
ncbi:MAG: hypothetical protein ABI451_02900 [Dokdonella sp.]